MRCRFADALVTVNDFTLKMQKVKDWRIMDLWWAVGNTLQAAWGPLWQAWLSVTAGNWSWLGETAALWSCLSPVLWTQAIRCPLLTCYTPRLRLLDLPEIWPWRSFAAPPGTCQPFTPSLGEHLEGEERQTRRPGRAAGEYWHGNRSDYSVVRLQRGV